MWIGLKYSEMPLRTSSSVTLISHMMRKNAIIAVMKSACATFHAEL